MYSRDVDYGELVVRENEPGNHLFVSAEGEFEIIVNNKVLGTLPAGKAFGELAILYNCRRTASIKGNKWEAFCCFRWFLSSILKRAEKISIVWDRKARAGKRNFPFKILFNKRFICFCFKSTFRFFQMKNRE
jgi:hypothetical protein